MLQSHRIVLKSLYHPISRNDTTTTSTSYPMTASLKHRKNNTFKNKNYDIFDDEDEIITISTLQTTVDAFFLLSNMWNNIKNNNNNIKSLRSWQFLLLVTCWIIFCFYYCCCCYGLSTRPMVIPLECLAYNDWFHSHCHS